MSKNINFKFLGVLFGVGLILLLVGISSAEVFAQMPSAELPDENNPQLTQLEVNSGRPLPAAQGIDPLITEQLLNSTDGKAEFFIAFTETADLSPAYSMDWETRGQFVVNTLKEVADRTQVNVRHWLRSRGIEYTVFWINNTIFVRADQIALNAISAFPEVSGFRGNHVSQIFPSEPYVADEPQDQTLAPSYPWNITFPMADQVHSLYGIKGQGVVVGGMDTGVDYDHIGLIQNYRGCLNPPSCTSFDHTYSWYDPSSSCGSTPCDTGTHGTQTMGIMVGDDDPTLPTGAWIGMAPDAQWIHCIGCPFGSCPETAINACAQWFLAPGGDPDMRPQVVNHSWGTWTPNDCNGNAFQAELMAYRAADILPAFAAGNVGAECDSSTSPANNTDPSGNPIAFASGAHGSGGSLDSYSSCGWNACNTEKLFPDVTSPGSDSCTTYPGDEYTCKFNGTSSASPHTAGCVALVRSANPSLTVAEVEQIIRDAANDVDDIFCGGTVDWNNRYGEGRLDCLEAVELASIGTGVLDGNVTGQGLPLEGATISAILSPSQYWQTNTDDQGDYLMNLVHGTYTVTASLYGYQPETVTDIEIVTDTVTTQNFVLTPATSALVYGNVTDVNTGWPLYTRIDITGYPYGSIWTDPVSGYYEVELPTGSAYDFHVEAFVDGYVALDFSVGPVGGDMLQNFTLDVNDEPCSAPGYGMGYAFFDDFEEGYSNWTMSGLWNPESQSDSCGSSVAPFPSPSNASWYGIDGLCTYNNGATNSGSLTMNASVSIHTGALLSFWSFEQTECGGDCYYDNRYIEISTNGGSTWTTLAKGTVENQWGRYSIDLSSYEGMNALFRMRFDTGDGIANDYFGWMVDDVSVVGCVPQSGGLVVGNVYDLNDGTPLPGAEVANDAGYETVAHQTPEDPAVDDGFYTLFSPSGDHLFTASMMLYADNNQMVSVVAGDTVTQDFSLGTGQLVVDPESLHATLDLGTMQTLPMTLTNEGLGDVDFDIVEFDEGFIPTVMGAGHGEWLYQAEQGVEMLTNSGETKLAYPSAYHWISDQPTDINVLIYADDFIHTFPNTFLDQALQALGIAYTAHYDGDFAGFVSDLQSQTWDLVLVGNDNYSDTSIFSPLNDYVLSGGKLVINTWTMSSDPSNPLWATLGVSWISNDGDPPDPVYWWDPLHPIFNDPESVPEFTSLSSGIYGTYGQRVEPMADYIAVAGYTTPGPDPNNAAIVLAPEGNTVFKGFLDGQNDANLDGDGWMDGVELWINLISGIQVGFAGDVPWLSTDPISGTIPGFSPVQMGMAEPPSPQAVPVHGMDVALSAQAVDPNIRIIPDGVFADVLWNQFNWSGTDFAAQDFEVAYDVYDIYAGDDFENAETWTVESIVTAGGWGGYVDLNNAIAIHWYLYPDAGGEPAGVPGDGSEYWSLTLPPSDPQVGLGVTIPEDVVLTLDAPISLPAGHWWLVNFVSLEYGLYGQWGWSGTSDVVWGSPGMQNNPGGGFGMDPGWNPNSYISDYSFTLMGSVGGEDWQVIEVHFDAAVVEQPGDYMATLRVNYDTPYGALNIPVTMTVTAPETYGKLEGTLTSLGYCDSNPAPLFGETVTIENNTGITWTVVTDDFGYFSYWLDEAGSPYTISTFPVEHEAGYAAGVVITGGKTSTYDLNLRWLAPCLEVDPEAFEVTLALGYSTTEVLELINSGAKETPFELTEREGTVSDFLAYVPPVASLEKATSVGVNNNASVIGMRSEYLPSGDILLNQPPNAENGFFSDAGCDYCSGGQQSIAENFTLPDGAVIGQVIFWTGYWPTDVEIDPDHLTVIFRSDSAGLPGTILYSEADVEYDREETGVILFGVHEWVHTLTLEEPVYLEPGNYWVEIFNDTGFSTDDFFWEMGDLDPVYGLAGSAFAFETPGTGWYYDGVTNLALQLVTADIDLPWVYESPSAGMIDSNSSIPVDVTFDTSVLSTYGDYTGFLRVTTDDENSPMEVPLLLHVVEPSYQAGLSPDASGEGVPGEIVTYVLTVTNMSNGPIDSFDLSVGVSSFPTTLSKSTIGPLAPSAYETFEAYVEIPADALVAELDVVDVTATSQGDGSKTASATLTTSVVGDYDVIMVADQTVGFGIPGNLVTYTVQLTNNNLLPDIIMLNVFNVATGWEVHLPQDSFSLAGGESIEITFQVYIPEGAGGGDWDEFTLQAKSFHDPSKWNEVVFTTTVNLPHVYLPLLYKP